MASFLKSLFQRFSSKENIPTDSHSNFTFDCKEFLNVMKTFTRQFNDTSCPPNQLFQIPNYLKNFVSVYFFHEVTKPVEYKNIPRDTVFVDMSKNPDKEIAFIDRLVQDSTQGLVQGLDATTCQRLRRDEFKSLLFGVLYIKAKWKGVPDEQNVFYNDNGTTSTVSYFKLEECRTRYTDNRVHVHIPFGPDTFIEFSREYAWDKYIQNEQVNIYLPQLDLKSRQEYAFGGGNIVINFKYKQDENGFEAACLYAYDAVDGELKSKPVQDIYFDEPFTIKLYSHYVDIFQVNVFNL